MFPLKLLSQFKPAYTPGSPPGLAEPVRVAGKLNGTQPSQRTRIDSVNVVEAKPREQFLFWREIVIHAGSVRVYRIRVRGVEAEPSGIDAVARREIVGLRIAAVEERQKLRVKPWRYRRASRLTVRGAWSRRRRGIRAGIQSRNLRGSQGGNALRRRLECAGRRAAGSVVDIGQFSLAHRIQ